MMKVKDFDIKKEDDKILIYFHFVNKDGIYQDGELSISEIFGSSPKELAANFKEFAEWLDNVKD